MILQTDLKSGALLRFAIGNEGLRILDGKLEAADLQYVCKVNRARAFADSYSKVSIMVYIRSISLSTTILIRII